jgi:hypothetical protein
MHTGSVRIGPAHESRFKSQPYLKSLAKLAGRLGHGGGFVPFQALSRAIWFGKEIEYLCGD